MCRGNPNLNGADTKQDGSVAPVRSDDELFEQMLDGRTRKARIKKQVMSTALLTVIVLIVAVLIIWIPTAVKLYAERIYPFERSVATYHFIVANPAMQNTTMYLNIKLTGILPAIMAHVPMDFDATLIPTKNTNVTALPEKFILIISGSTCAGFGEPLEMTDGTCKLPLARMPSGIYMSHFDSVRYLAAGDFPLLLATDSLFDGNVVSTGSEHISISSFEPYIANQYAFIALIVAILGAIAFILSEFYKASRKESGANS